MVGALARGGSLGHADLIQRPIDHRLEFARVFYFAAFGQNFPGFLGAEPGGIPAPLVRFFYPLHLEQERLDYILPHSGSFPENSFGMDIEAEMPGLNAAADAGFFAGFAFRRLAMGEIRFGITLGKRPLAAAV